jgi:hypothetical protein
VQAVAAIGLLLGCLQEVQAAPVLPDLIAWADQSKNYIYGGSVNASLVPGETVYQFIGALPNIGPGRLEVREVTHPDATQDVYQRIYDENDALDHERLIGSFPDADSIAPRHLWLPGIAQYRLRTVLEDNSAGPIVASNDKTSMAVVDSAAYDKTLPGAPQSPVYNNFSAGILGISVGWADIYGTIFPGQWVPVTGLADGQYWLEVFVDPYDRIQEADETNNVTQILIELTVPEPTILKGDYNRDGTVNAADYTVWRNTLGQSDFTKTGKGADGDASGTIRPADYEIWKTRFGQSAGSGSVTAVPEPSFFAAVLALLGYAAVCGNRCRRRCVDILLTG